MNEEQHADNTWPDMLMPYVDKLNQANGNWETLTEKEQELAALWKLETDLFNGGFIQFFCNWGYSCYLHAVRALSNIGAVKSLEIIRPAYKVIERLEDDNRVEELWDIPKYLTDQEIETLGDLDKAWSEHPDNREGKALRYYQSKTGQ